jgi:uracil-DNA glycosylase
MALSYCEISEEWIDIFNSIPQQIRDKVDSDILQQEAKLGKVLATLPIKEKRLEAFKYFKPDETKIVIFGQDPYQNKGLPMGLSFSVPVGVTIPPSLRNIYKELETDITGFTQPASGDLTSWAKQGVLLLNTALTVLEGSSNSNAKIWNCYMQHFLQIFSERHPDVVYIMFGKNASALKKYIKAGYFIETTHPSPLAVGKGGFFGERPFSRANEILLQNGKTPIDWCSIN